MAICFDSATARAELSASAKNEIDCAVAFNLTAAAMESVKPPTGRTEEDRAEMVAGYKGLSKTAMEMAIKHSSVKDFREQTSRASALFAEEVKKTQDIQPLLAAVKKCREAGIPQGINGE